MEPSTTSLSLIGSLIIGPCIWGVVEIIKRKIDLTPAITQAVAVVGAFGAVWLASKMFAPGLGYEDLLQNALAALGVSGIAVATQKHIQEKKNGAPPPGP